MKIHSFEADSISAEWMEERSSRFAPIIEPDPKLECSLGAFDEVEFVEAQVRIEIVDVGNAGFAYADGSNCRGLDQSDLRRALGEELGQARRGAPASRSAADDDNGRNGIAWHGQHH